MRMRRMNCHGPASGAMAPIVYYTVSDAEGDVATDSSGNDDHLFNTKE